MEEELPNSIRNTSTAQNKVPLFSLLKVADKFDYLLMFLGSIGAIIHGAAPPLLFLLFGRIINSLGSLSSDHHALTARVSEISLHLVYLGLVMLFSSWISIASWKQTGERQAAQLRLKYLEAILQKEIQFFDTEGQRESLVFRISSDAILVQDAIGDKIATSLRHLSQFFSGMMIGFILVWQLTLVTLVIIPLMVVAGAYNVILSNLSHKAESAYAQSGKIAEEVLSQIRTVYSFGGESRAVEEYSRSLEKVIKFGKKSGITKGVGMGLTFGLLLCTWALLLWYASVLIRRQQTDGGKVFATILNVIFSGFALGHAFPGFATIAKGNGASRNILSMMDTNFDSCKPLLSGTILSELHGGIEFCEVSFAYPSRSTMVFERLSFTFSASKTFAVVGPSGSGKSTIISLIQGFYEPTSGAILLDGHDLRGIQLKWWREQMGLVNQEPVLFATTIAANILFGKEGANMDQIVEAAKTANAHSFIQDLPHGYNTQVGEGGAKLSGGQKQRIAIARAVLRNPKILLLDEATSALDMESEHTVQKTLDLIMSDRTTIVIAHRLSTIKGADQIIFMNNGRVTEFGAHEELMQKGGEFAALVSLQSESVNEHQSGITLSISHHGQLGLTLASDSKLSLIEDNTKLVKTMDPSPCSPSIKELVKLNAREWPYALLGSLGAILSGLQIPVFALGITNVLTKFYSHDKIKVEHDVKVIAFLFLLVAAFSVPINLLQQYFYTVMGEHITTRVRLATFSAMLKNEPGWFDLDENNVGSLMSKLAADATVVRTALVEQLSIIVQNGALTIAAFVIAFMFSWRMAAVTVTIFPLLIGASLTEKYFLKGFAANYASSYSKANALAREAIANIRTIVAFGAEDRISAEFASALSQPKKQAFVRGHVSGVGYGLSQFLAYSSYALTLWYASILVDQGKNSFTEVMTSFMVLVVTAFAVAEASSLTSDLVKGSEALGSIFAILNRKTAIDSDDPNSKMVESIEGNIEFRDVSFEYPTRPEIIVLNKLNLKVPSWKSLAVVGQSGSGKSTLIALVMRFYDPSYGSICIDGVDIRILNLISLRRRMSLVQQEPALFCTTIYENICYGNENATEVEITQAAKAANADEFISRMPQGYQSVVGERGCKLSGGQKQRVAIARAILKDPSILLLDEATSALDTASEKLVQQALDKLMMKRTTIVVAHRLSTIRNVDNIAVVKQGKVAEIGSHEELISTHGSVYSQLISFQQETKDSVSSSYSD